VLALEKHSGPPLKTREPRAKRFVTGQSDDLVLTAAAMARLTMW